MIKNGITIDCTSVPDMTFNEKISKELNLKCETISGIKINHNCIYIYLIKDNPKIAGVIAFIYRDILWIDSMHVLEPEQNKGFGSQLISKINEVAIKQSVKEIQLNTFFSDSVQFFKKNGFSEVAVIPNWKYNLTCHLMRKNL